MSKHPGLLNTKFYGIVLVNYKAEFSVLFTTQTEVCKAVYVNRKMENPDV